MKHLNWDENEFCSTDVNEKLQNLSEEEKRLITVAPEIVLASHLHRDRAADLLYAYQCGQEQQQISVDLKRQFLADKEALEQFALGEKSGKPT